MAVPSVCTITSPVNNFTTAAGPAGTATMTVSVTTDAATAVSIKIGAGAYGAPVTSNGSGVATFTGVAFPVGSNALRARAGTDPDFLESSIITVIVQNLVSSITDPVEWSSERYLNWLAGNTVFNTAVYPSAKEAACTWAGVSPIDYSLAGALNVKAGVTDRSRWVSVNAALNLLAYATLDRTLCVPWLSNQQALLKICKAV